MAAHELQKAFSDVDRYTCCHLLLITNGSGVSVCLLQTAILHNNMKVNKSHKYINITNGAFSEQRQVKKLSWRISAPVVCLLREF